MENKFYVYMHIKETDGEPFYIGKGKGDRVLIKGSRSIRWKNYVNKYGYDIIMIEEKLTEQKAFEVEKYWIQRIGRKDLGLGPLINMTDGGDGVSGFKGLAGCNNPSFGKKRTQEQNEHHSNLMKGRTPWNKGKKGVQTAWNKGIKSSEETKNKLSKSHSRKKKVIDVSNGNIFESVECASRIFNINVGTLRSYLKGRVKNKTTLKFL